MKIGRRAVSFLLLAGVTLAAQSRFDVVSIKPASPAGPPPVIASMLMIRTGSVQAAGITAVDLIGQAYRTVNTSLRPSHVFNAPAWAATERYAFAATFDANRSLATLRDDLPQMYRAVLEERFRLRGHADRRPVPVYALVVARSDGRLGPQLRHSAGTGAGGGERYSGRDYFDGYGVTIDALASALDSLGQVDREIVNRTGLTGRFDLDLYWSADRTMAMLGRGTAAAVDGATVFEALAEQLGLKLEPRNERAEVFVVDHIERPSAN
ncbi:MAG TPA: TIGR03435 family protein [Vicinamibacterales bacterium]|jgi:uncharacterized protein (TIGR03435 family)|nr:TIGR03435 family protein [Vicinamibacterales bacterium]